MGCVKNVKYGKYEGSVHWEIGEELQVLLVVVAYEMHGGDVTGSVHLGAWYSHL